MRQEDVLISPVMPLIRLFGTVACWGVIAILHLAEPGPTDRTLAIHGLYDETGHLLTALMIAIGLRGLNLPIPIWSVLVGGVVLDFGHILNLLDYTEPISGSTRNGTHSVFALILLASIGFIDRRHANVWLGITLGALSHLWRDMGTGAVPLVWPFMENVEGTSFTRCMIGLLGASIAMIGSGALLETHVHANLRQANRDDRNGPVG